MILKGKRKNARLLVAAALVLCMLTACGSGGKGSASSQSQTSSQQSGSQQDGSQAVQSAIPENSVVNFQKEKGYVKLQEDMKNGDIPIECNVLYDEDGARPDVTVTDPDMIREIYGQLADITVGDKTSERVTGKYHHITFRLRNDTYVSFYFEGDDLFCRGEDNYTVSGSKNLWNSVRQLQNTAMKENQTKTAEKTDQTEQSNTSKTASASARSSSKGSTRENAISGTVSDAVNEDIDLSSEDSGNVSGVAVGISGSTGGQDTQDDAQSADDTSGSGIAPETPADQETDQSQDISGETETGSQTDTAGDTETQTQTDPADASDTADTKDAANTADTADTADTSAAADTGEAAQAADTAGDAQADPAEEQSDSSATAQTAAAAEIADPALNPDMEAAYTEIVRAYAKVLAVDKDTFMNSFNQGSYSPQAPDFVPAPDFDERINYELFRDLYTNSVPGEVLYGLHDYNADGIQELVIAVGEGEYKTVRAMYTFDGTKAVSLFTGSLTPAYRVDVLLLLDGRFIVHGSGGATSGSDTICRIADDASGLEIAAEYTYDASENGNMDHYSPTGEVVTEADFYELFGTTTNPADGISFTPASEDAEVSLLPAAE